MLMIRQEDTETETTYCRKHSI